MNYLPIDDLTDELVSAYKETPDYLADGKKFGIQDDHPLVVEREEKGLKESIEYMLQRPLETEGDFRRYLAGRTPEEFISEWVRAQELLFSHVYRPGVKSGIRKQPARFGSPGDEVNIYHIPQSESLIRSKLIELSYVISAGIMAVTPANLDEICSFIAKVHLKFICIHPFIDGNGRIGRALVDQLSIALGAPPVLTGYPRTNEEKKKVYHAAIYNSAKNDDVAPLSDWIKGQIEDKISQLA